MSKTIQARLKEKELSKFEEIRSNLLFEKMKGKHLTPSHEYSTGKQKEITDADVIRFIIRHFQFKD